MSPLHIAREIVGGLQTGWAWGWALNGTIIRDRIRARVRTVLYGWVRP